MTTLFAEHRRGHLARSGDHLRSQVLNGLMVVGLAVASAASGETAGVGLVEALEQLRSAGVETLYTSRLVTADQRVDHVPARDLSPRHRLRRLLAPHGLAAEAMPDGRFVIVAARRGGLEGVVRAAPGGDPLPGATIRLATRRVVSDPLGRFRLHAIAVGEHEVAVSRPGYRPTAVSLTVADGSMRRLEIELTIDTDVRDEIFVSTTPAEPSLGTWRLRSSDRDSAARSDPDLLTAVGRSPGTTGDLGVSFGVRGGAADQVTVVIDGMELVEPYHFRDLGRLAGVVTPSAIAEVELHRGVPPIVFGDRAGGVVEMVTDTARDRFGGRWIHGVEATQAAVDGSAGSGRWRGLAAYREGRPDLPRELAELDGRPLYWDAVAKLNVTLGERHESSVHAVSTEDEYSFIRDDPAIPAQVLGIVQDSLQVAARHQAVLGRDHLITAFAADIETRRTRAGVEVDPQILLPPSEEGSYSVSDGRATVRAEWRLGYRAQVSERLDVSLGVEANDEQTIYDYYRFADFFQPDERVHDWEGTIRQRLRTAFAQATWRPRAEWTLSAGLRVDTDAQQSGSTVSPRVALGVDWGPGILRARWARIRTPPSTYALPLADGDRTLPPVELSDHVAIGYAMDDARGHWAVEIYQHRASQPRWRFENLFKPISRFPELEIDRLRIAPETGRRQGVELRRTLRGDRWQAQGVVEVGRAEDRVEGVWRPRRGDHRYAAHLWWSRELSPAMSLDVAWRGHDGLPTTRFDVAAAREDFAAGLGELYGDRLPADHQLDVRWRQRFGWRGLEMVVELGVDNAYDRRRVRGFDLLALADPSAPPRELPPELGLGRRWRWGVEIAW
ncbi:MAG: TonB-dependent receptor [Acidobacteriota bacterium]